MKKKLIICLITILLISVGFSGCFDNDSNNGSSVNGNGSKTEIIMTEFDYELHWDEYRGDYIIINLLIKNNGSTNATNVRVSLYSTNQNNLLEANKTFYILTNLSVNEVDDANFRFDYEEETTTLYNKIKILWNGGSKEYLRIIDL